MTWISQGCQRLNICRQLMSSSTRTLVNLDRSSCRVTCPAVVSGCLLDSSGFRTSSVKAPTAHWPILHISALISTTSKCAVSQIRKHRLLLLVDCALAALVLSFFVVFSAIASQACLLRSKRPTIQITKSSKKQQRSLQLSK